MHAAAVVVALVLALGGCGGGEQSPEGAVTDWLEALGEGRAEEACGAMTDTGRRELVRMVQIFADGRRDEGDCERQVEHFARGRGAPDDLETRVESEVGDRVRVATEGDGPGTVELRREDGAWRVHHFLRDGWRGLGIPRYPGGLPQP